MTDKCPAFVTIDVKLRVQHKDGRMETLDIAEPLWIREGAELDRIVAPDGTEHFFTKEGYYDGWGKAMAESEKSSREKKS